MCAAARLYKEQGLIYFKTGQQNMAMEVLMNNCLNNVDEIVDLCRLYGVPENDIWTPILAKARDDNSKVP